MGSSDLFQIVTHPMQPGICRVCGVSYGTRDMVDTGLTADFCNRQHYNPVTEEVYTEVDMALAGAVYFCESCVANMGELVGMLPMHKVRSMTARMQELEAQNEALTKKNLGLEKVLDGYRDLLSPGITNVTDGAYLVSDVPNSSDSESNSKPQSEFTDLGDGTIPAEVVDGADFGDSETDELSGVNEQADGVPSTTSSKSRGTGKQPAGKSNAGGTLRF